MSWKLELKNSGLSDLYSSYLYQQERLLIHYVSSVYLSENFTFDSNASYEPIKASDNFIDEATSIKSIKDIESLTVSGEYLQMTRSSSIIGLLTTFTDFFNELVKLLNLQVSDVKTSFHVISKSGVDIKISTAPLKIMNFVGNTYKLDTPLVRDDAVIKINCYIKMRHMFMHDKGRYNNRYKDHMFNSWSNLVHGERIIFDKNQFDSVLHYLNSHLKHFVQKLDEKI